MPSLSHLLYGDYDVSYATDLPVSEAVGRLVVATDQISQVERRGISTLRGYATTHEVVVWQDAPYFLSTFRPVFRGRFIRRENQTHLQGRVATNWIIKAWVSAPIVIAVVLGAVVFSGGTVHSDSSAAGAVIAGVIVAAVFVFLRLMIRPGSMLAQPLEDAITLAIAGRRSGSP